MTHDEFVQRVARAIDACDARWNNGGLGGPLISHMEALEGYKVAVARAVLAVVAAAVRDAKLQVDSELHRGDRYDLGSNDTLVEMLMLLEPEVPPSAS